MVLHPAEFARKGYSIINEVSERIAENNENTNNIIQILGEYEPVIADLIQSRVEWSTKDYFVKNIEVAIYGGISLLLITLATVVFAEKMMLIHLSLSQVILLYFCAALVGGVFGCYVKGPKPLSEHEKKHDMLVHLNHSPNILQEYFENFFPADFYPQPVS